MNVGKSLPQRILTCLTALMCWKKTPPGTRPQLNRPNAVIQLGDQTVNALLDTGSTVTLCDDSIRPTPGFNCRPLPLSMNLQILRAANGGQLTISRFMRVKINMGRKQLHPPVLFIKGLQVPCILGMDFMSRARVVIDTQNQKIRIEEVPHFRAEDNLTLTNRMTDIVLGKDHSVPPLSESKVTCTVHSTFEDGLISNIKQGPCHLMDGVVKLTGSSKSTTRECCAIILNAGHEPIHLAKNTVIGQFEGLLSESFQPIETVLQINKNNRVILADTSHLSQVKLDHLPLSVKGKYQALLREYANIFSRHDLDVGHSQTLPHTVRLTDHSKVVSVNQYCLPYHLKEVAIDYVEKLLKSGVI